MKSASVFLAQIIAILLVSMAPGAALAQGWRDRALHGEHPGWAGTSSAIPSAEYRTPSDARPGIQERTLPPRPARGGPMENVVSVERLVNAPPGKALKEMQKGQEAVAKGEREEAIEHYEKAIEIHPSYVEAYNNLGVQNLKLDRIDAAIEALEKAVELDPSSAEPHLNLSIALHAAGQLDAARYQAERAFEIAPYSPSVSLGLGLVLTAQGKDLERAVQRLSFASGEHPGALLAAAEALLQLNRPKEAQAALRGFFQAKPGALE